MSSPATTPRGEPVRDYAVHRAFAREAAGEAAALAVRYFGRVSGTIKDYDPTQVLTEADVAIGRLLVDRVRRAFPDHNAIDEEAGVVDNGSDWTWVIDPIDGTSNFAVGIPLYGILIGLLHEDVPVVGAIALPASGDVFTAALGAGADKNGVRLPRVDDATPLSRRLICYGVDGDRASPETTRAEGQLLADIALACVNVRNTGSVYDGGLLVEGRVGAVMYRVARIWDVVAPQVVAQEAGCRVTALDGSPLGYAGALTDPLRRYTYCAAAPNVHGALGEILARHAEAIA